MNAIILRAETSDFIAIDVCYRLLNTPIAKKYVHLLNASLSNAGESATRNTMIVSEHSSAQINNALCELNLLVKSLANQHPILKEWKVYPENIGQPELNKLHECFEKFERYQVGTLLEIREKFSSLNHQIHLIEGLLDRSKQKSENPKIYFSTEPYLVAQELLEPSDYEFLDVQLKPGRLYMGYYTVGKNWLSVYRQNDLALIKDRKISPQTHANTQIVGILSGSSYFQMNNGDIIDDFYRWWDANNVSQYGYEKKNWQSLALGWLPIAELDCVPRNELLKKYLSITKINGIQLV